MTELASKNYLEKVLDIVDDSGIAAVAGMGIAALSGVGAVALAPHVHPPVIIEITQNSFSQLNRADIVPWPQAQNPGPYQTWGAIRPPLPDFPEQVSLRAKPSTKPQSQPIAPPSPVARISFDDWYKEVQLEQRISNKSVPVPIELTPALKRLDPDLRAGIFAEAKNTRIPVSLTIAQAINETGGSNACNNNYFGVKGPPDSHVSGLCHTWESINGRAVYMDAWFRKFATPRDAVAFNHSLIENYKPIKELLDRGEKDPRQFAYALQRAGYATDPIYPQKLIKLMETYNLFQYDVQD